MGKKLLIILLLPLLLILAVRIIFADELQDKQKQITELEQKVVELQKQAKTLSDQINSMDSQIKLTTLRISDTEDKIAQAEKEIATLSEKIARLEDSLTSVSQILLNRITETYKRSSTDPFYLFISSENFGEFFRQLKYLQAAQAHDKRLMIEMQATKEDYSDQKKILEDKKVKAEALKKQLEQYKITLDQQKKDKEVLLEVTRNDEKRYQEMLASARAEYQAILRILAGQGDLTKVGGIKAGETVGYIISGRSPCSTGTHLHFEVQVNGQNQDPAKYLKNISLKYDYDTGKIPEFINATGSWDWPVDDPVMIEQIYGMSYWARVLNYYGGGPHTGVDIVSDSSSKVKAVADGVLYKGSISCGGGALRFSRVDQADGIQTYYLHIN